MSPLRRWHKRQTALTRGRARPTVVPHSWLHNQFAMRVLKNRKKTSVLLSLLSRLCIPACVHGRSRVAAQSQPVCVPASTSVVVADHSFCARFSEISTERNTRSLARTKIFLRTLNIAKSIDCRAPHHQLPKRSRCFPSVFGLHMALQRCAGQAFASLWKRMHCSVTAPVLSRTISSTTGIREASGQGSTVSPGPETGNDTELDNSISHRRSGNADVASSTYTGGTNADLKLSRVSQSRIYYPGQSYETDDLAPRGRFDTETHSATQTTRRAPMRGKDIDKHLLESLDFRNASLLTQFISETGKILPRRKTGLSAKVHRKMVKQVKTSRMMGVIPFTERLSQLGTKRKSM